MGNKTIVRKNRPWYNWNGGWDVYLGSRNLFSETSEPFSEPEVENMPKDSQKLNVSKDIRPFITTTTQEK